MLTMKGGRHSPQPKVGPRSRRTEGSRVSPAAFLWKTNRPLQLPAQLIRWGVIGTVLADILSLGTQTSFNVFSITTDPTLYSTNLRTISMPTPNIIGMLLLPVAAMIVGIGWMMLAIRIADNPMVYGMYHFIRTLFLIIGFIMIVQVMSVMTGRSDFLDMSAILLGICSPIKAGALTLLFYRAAQRQPPVTFA